MAHQESIISWLYKVRHEVGLELHRHQWPAVFNSDLFDFSVSISYQGKKFIGRAVDSNENLAIEKASCEALERVICQEFDMDSVGLSVGRDYDFESHAKNEALERFFLKKHISEKINFSMVATSTELIKGFVRTHGFVDIKLFSTNSSPDYCTYGCLLSVGSKRSVGFSLSNDEARAQDKAFLEALPNLAWLVDTEMCDSEKPWHLKKDFLDQIEILMGNTNNEKKIEDPEIERVEINLRDHLFLKDAPIDAIKYVVKI